MKKRTLLVGVAFAVISLAACGGNITPATDETTVIETSVTETTVTEKTTLTTTEEMPQETTEETAETEVPTIPDGSSLVDTHEYEVFNDGQEHTLTYYIDDAAKMDYRDIFKSTDMFKGWGISSISIPTVDSIIQSEPIALDLSVREEENRYAYAWDQHAVYDDSAWFPGSKSYFTYADFFRVWRASAANYTIDYNAPDPMEIFKAYYNFYDRLDYTIYTDKINVRDEGNGVIGYKFMIGNPFLWDTGTEKHKCQGYMYVRVDPTKDYVHCIIYGNRYEMQGAAEADYILLHSATYTNFDDITEGDICTE